MKKSLRLLALFAALMLLCIISTGCNALDDMRTRHGYYASNGSVRLNGDTYLPLPQNEYFSPYGSDESLINITAKEVPVLLSGLMGETFISYNKGDIIASLDSVDSKIYYCRENVYFTLAPMLAAEFAPTGYCYEYETFNEKDETYSTQVCHLTNAQAETLDNILMTVESTHSDTDYYDDYSIPIQACTDNLLLREGRFELVYTGINYLITETKEDDDVVAYVVPSQYDNQCAAIMKPYIDSKKAQEAYWEEMYGEKYMDDEDIVLVF